MSRFLVEKYKALAPYQPGAQPAPGSRVVKLNTNENPYGPSPRVAEAVRSADFDTLRRYPDLAARQMGDAIGRRFGLTADRIEVGNGSDELLAFAFMAFGGPDRPAIFPDITYGFYKVYAQVFGVPYAELPLEDDFSVDPAAYCQPGRFVVLANPNAPTGLALTLEQLRRIAAADLDRVVLIDEAYADFDSLSAAPLLAEFDNLLLLHTLSKSRSLAGGRAAFALGSPALIGDLRRIKYSVSPYNLDMLTQLAAAAAIEDEAWMQRTAAAVRATRARVITALRARDFAVTDARANFIFARSPALPGGELARRLAARGVLIRHFPGPRTGDWVRVSIGTDDEMDLFLAETDAILKEAAQ